MAKNRANWSNTKKKWKNLNPSDEQGNYECWICHQPVHMSIVSLDHVAPVELYPEYMNDLSNIRPAHVFCNQARVDGHMKTVKRKINRISRRRRK